MFVCVCVCVCEYIRFYSFIDINSFIIINLYMLREGDRVTTNKSHSKNRRFTPGVLIRINIYMYEISAFCRNLPVLY